MKKFDALQIEYLMNNKAKEIASINNFLILAQKSIAILIQVESISAEYLDDF